MIKEFQGEFRWLSNFWSREGHSIMICAPSGVSGQDHDVFFPTVEHAYQMCKAGTWVEFHRQTGVELYEYMHMTPGQAKRLGHSITLPPNWDTRRLQIMGQLLRDKFAWNHTPELAQKLVGTYPHELVEGNRWHDTFWGRCLCNEHHGCGHNHLGKLLMQIRDELMSQQ